MLNGWEEFYMTTALQSLPYVTGRPTNPLITYSDQQSLKPTSTSSAVCFEAAFSLGETNNFYLDQAEARLFQTLAHQALGYNQRLPRSTCTPSQMQVLFLTRPHPLPRPLWNADALLQELKAHGFSKIHSTSISENTPYFQQVGLFQAADLIISVHGSQLGNLIFMQDEAAIVEIFPHKYFSTQPKSLSNVIGSTHYVMTNNSLPPAQLVAEQDPTYSKDLAQCQVLSKRFPDDASCKADQECRYVLRTYYFSTEGCL